MMTTCTMTLEPAEIVRIPFPFSNPIAVKQRPVLVLTTPDSRGDFLCMAITSKGHHARAVPIGEGDLATGALPVASWIRPDKAFTLEAGAVVAQMGVVTADCLARALDGLCSLVAPGRD